jgi:site-specific recombinase XerD
VSKEDGAPVGNLRIARGKGRKQRELPLNYWACRALKAYLAVRPGARAAASTAPLFLNKYGTALSPRPIQKMLEKYLAEAGIEGASPHALRHTFATHMVKSGAQLRSVQEMLGHTDLKTTSIYVSLAREQMEKDVQRHAL